LQPGNELQSINHSKYQLRYHNQLGELHLFYRMSPIRRDGELHLLIILKECMVGMLTSDFLRGISEIPRDRSDVQLYLQKGI
jgi:hypothetical protein